MYNSVTCWIAMHKYDVQHNWGLSAYRCKMTSPRPEGAQQGIENRQQFSVLWILGGILKYINIR